MKETFLRFKAYFTTGLAVWVTLTLGGCAHYSRARSPAIPTSSIVATQRFEFTRPQMGLPFRIVVHATNQVHAVDACRAAFARIEQLNNILSDYDADSELSRFSRTSGFETNVLLSPELWHVLSLSQILAQQTSGAFDVTAGPVVNLWRKARREHRLPRADLLQQALNRVGW